MALYAIGDVQGCFDELRVLLTKIDFDKRTDRLWFTGDLVNRGPKSLETLRYIKSLGDAAITVLGNHDLHLLALHITGKPAKNDETLKPILDAPDRSELMDWLRHRPLIHTEKNFCLVHAGLPPNWKIEMAVSNAKQVERVLRCESAREYFDHMYGDSPKKWSESLGKWEKLRFITNCLTRMRYCDAAGNINLTEKGHPKDTDSSLIPWFEYPDRQNNNVDIVFGHWSTLGFCVKPGIYGIDTGCLWGGELSAIRLDGKEVYRVCIQCGSNKRNHSKRKFVE